MKICKQIAAAALSVCLLLPIGACSFSLYEEKPIAYRVTYTSDDESIFDAVATEEIDAALLERGYSEQFIDWTGDETKRMLFEEDAVCQSLAGVSAGRVPVDERYIYGIAAVSALPAEEEGVVRKIATFSWQWQGEERLSGDYISLGWQWDSPSGYTLVPEQTMFELSGKGDKRDERWKGSIQIPPVEEGTFLLRRGAEAVYTPEGQAQIKETIAYYMENARIMRESLSAAGFQVYGGVNAPYVWVQAPDGMSSWKFFDKLLYEAHVVTTPGIGFGPSGEGYVRLTAFGEREDCEEAMRRIRR